MKIKTSELSGPALDRAVAKARGMVHAPIRGKGTVRADGVWADALGGGVIGYVFSDDYTAWIEKCDSYPWFSYQQVWHPSTNWAQGGPILEQEKIDLFYYNAICVWQAQCVVASKDFSVFGSTPLITAMRCYVTSNLGDEVEVPEELL